MGRTIARQFFHPYEANSEKSKIKVILQNWKDTNSPFYYDQIPIYMNKIYRSIDVKLEKECNSVIPSKQCIPKITFSHKYVGEVIQHIKNSPLYESVKFNVNYNKELPELINLITSQKHFMYYIHIPKETDGMWFCEGRFFTLEELESSPSYKDHKKIEDFVKSKGIDYMDFMEEWVGLIFHLAAEYLLFKKKVKVIFYSCEKCYRPALFIKEEIKNEDDDSNKIWGTVNIVDTIIYNCTKGNFSYISKGKQRSKNNIIYHDESFYNRPKAVNKDCEIFKNETDGAFILTTTEAVWDNLIKEIKGKGNKYKFDLIITGSTAKKILKKINKLKADDYINRICIYTINIDKYQPLTIEFPKIKGVFRSTKKVVNFIRSEEQNSEIYPTIHLITYNSYIQKYMVLHKLISSYYAETEDKNCFKRAISYLKDFLLWYPKLLIKRKKNKEDIEKERIDKINELGMKEEIIDTSEKREIIEKEEINEFNDIDEIKEINIINEKDEIKEDKNRDQIKIEVLLETLQRFKGINDNEEDIIKLYTKENRSFYQDFNSWLLNLDPLAIEKTSWFIAAVISSLNKYAQKKGKGLKENKKLYRGIKSNLSDLLDYERAKGEIICFPSFTSSSMDIDVAKRFSKPKPNSNQYETLITINYIYKEGFIPTAVDVSNISAIKKEKEYLFLPYSFFIVKNVQIKHSKKKAEIELDTVGKKEMFEKYLNNGYELAYNEKGFMDIIKQEPKEQLIK